MVLQSEFLFHLSTDRFMSIISINSESLFLTLLLEMENIGYSPREKFIACHCSLVLFRYNNTNAFPLCDKSIFPFTFSSVQTPSRMTLSLWSQRLNAQRAFKDTSYSLQRGEQTHWFSVAFRLGL